MNAITEAYHLGYTAYHAYKQAISKNHIKSAACYQAFRTISADQQAAFIAAGVAVKNLLEKKGNGQ